MQPPQPLPKKLLDQVRGAIRVKHYSYRTEETYVQWIRRYILFHDKRPPKDMGVPEIEAFLTHLAVTKYVAAATQNQALSALIFYNEVSVVIQNMSEVHGLIVRLLYSGSLRSRIKACLSFAADREKKLFVLSMRNYF